MRRALAVTLALFAAILALALVRYRPPAPVPASAPPEVFSAERARALQERVVADGASRWVGTEANARARGVIEAELERLGFTVESQRATSCTSHGVCAVVTNVVGVLAGRDPALPGVLLGAHYDSVPVSPGASDDGVGVAVLLEASRALAAGERPRRTIVALFADGEEAGLLGADVFVREHARARQVRFTVNVDARGSRGPSQMFETSQGNAWLVELVAAELPRPVTTSLFYEVYKRMPNDTDFSVTKTVASGVNFANTAGIEHYHSPLDDLANADPGTLQHHGDHLLAMARAFAATDGPGPGAGGDAVWFDVLAFGVVRWPASWTPLLALLALALLVGHAARARAFDRGLAGFVPILAAGVAAAGSVGLGVKRTLPALFVAHPGPTIAALHLAAAAAGLAAGLAFARRAGPRALWAGIWLGWAAIGVAVAFVAPGIAYLFVVPALVAALAGALPPPVRSAAPAVVAALLVLALAPALYETLGFSTPVAIALPTFLLAPTLAPMLPGLPAAVTPLRLAAALATGSALLLGVGASMPPFDASVPQRVNVVLRQDERGARVFVDASWGAASWGRPPWPMVAALGRVDGRERALPWTLEAPFAADTPVPAAAPELEVLESRAEGDRRRVRARVRSARGAPSLALVFTVPPGASAAERVELEVDGRLVAPRPVAGGALVGLFAAPAEGFLLELDLPRAPVSALLFDRTFGVPAGSKAQAAVEARRATGRAQPTQDGDQTLLVRALEL